MRESKLEELSSSILKNLDRYRYGSFEDYGLDNQAWSFSSAETKFSPQDLETLVIPNEKGNFEAENSLIVYQAFRNLTKYQACRPGLWTYYCHLNGLNYIRHRYRKEFFDEDKEKAVKSIVQHCFSNGSNRQLTRDNALSRLYWNGCLLSRIEPAEKRNKAAIVLLTNTDIRASLVERPALITSNAFEAAIDYLIHKYDVEGPKGKFFLRSKQDMSNQRNFSYREMFKFLNRLGGKLHLNLLEPEEIVSFIQDFEIKF